jgi:hypothetical protein
MHLSMTSPSAVDKTQPHRAGTAGRPARDLALSKRRFTTAGGPVDILLVAIEGQRRAQLRSQINSAMAAVAPSSLLEAQFTLRELARQIACDVFGGRALAAVRRHLASGGIALWDGLPTADEVTPAARMTFGQAIAAVVAQGESFGFREEDGGLHYQRLVPVSGVENSGMTPDQLQPHLDNPMLYPWAQPEVIHLVCVENDADVATQFFTMRSVIGGLREGYGEHVVGLLKRNAYLTAISNSFITGDARDKAVFTRARPILYRPSGQGRPTHFLGKSYDMCVLDDIDRRDEYRHALDAYQAVLRNRSELALEIVTQPGQAVSFHQQRLLHGRGPVPAAKHREMVRAYVRFDFSNLLRFVGRVPPLYVFSAIELIDREPPRSAS